MFTGLIHSGYMNDCEELLEQCTIKSYNIYIINNIYVYNTLFSVDV